MAQAQPPRRESRSQRNRPATTAGAGPVSRRDRNRRQRETRSERQFALGFALILAFTVLYLIARSPLMRLLKLH